MTTPHHDRLHALLIALERGDGSVDAPLREQLNALLRDDPQSREAYLDHIEVQAVLRRRFSTPLAADFAIDPAEEQAVSSRLEPSRSSNAVHRAARSALTFFARPAPLSTSIAALAMGLLIAAMYLISAPVYRTLTEQSVVAHLTGSHEARWAEQHQAFDQGMELLRGQELQLLGGLAEIRMASGVVIVLRGPAKIVLVDDDLVRLSQGVVAATVPPEAIGFQVVAPHMRIVDLGTQFGAAVDASATDLHVFQGSVETTLLGRDGERVSTQRLTAGEALRWNALAAQREAVAVKPAAFAVALPKRAHFPVVSTGRELFVGQADPHWQVIAARGIADFQPTAAVVTQPNPAWVAGGASRSQWISLGVTPTIAPFGVVYTFRTQFDMSDLDPTTAYIIGRVASDDEIVALRVNGKPIDLPENSLSYKQFSRLRISGHFQSGANQLEFDVYNSSGDSPIGLRAELVGFADTQVNATENIQNPKEPRPP